MNGGNVIFKFTGDDGGLKSTINRVGTSFGTMTKSILTATGITKAFSMTMDMVKGSTGQAITRLDTLNQFPRVMQSLGISAEDAEESITIMSKRLEGLPTTLDQGANSVKRFTAYNGDVKKSTEAFLAVNNAILAGGASMEIQSSALEQLTQAYTKGKPEAQDWKTIMQAMPAQLKQIANSMGYTSTAIGGDFYTALIEGEITMDDFMNTAIQLNEKGGNGFASFAEQAKEGTKGVQTAISVMKTRVAQGMAELINSVDVGLKDFGGLSGVLVKIGDTLKGALKSLAPMLTQTIGFLAKNLPTILNVLSTFAPIILSIVGAFKAYTATVKVITAITKAWAIVQALLNGTLLLNPIGLIVAGIALLIGGIILLYTKCEWFRNLINPLFKTIGDAIKQIINAVKPLVNMVITAMGEIMTALKPVIDFIVKIVVNYVKFYIQMVINYINFMVSVIKGIIAVITFVVSNVINGVKVAINFFKSIPEKAKLLANKILNSFGGLPKKMLSVGLDIVRGIGNGITSGITWIKNRIKEFVGNVKKFIMKLFKIGSPSKLMRDDVGQWIPKGIAVGIEANTSSVYDAMKTMQDDISSSFGLSPQLTGSTALNYSPNVVVNNNIDMKTDPLGQVVGNIKTFSGGAKNDYNYGMGV